jgi:hypothetical protein
MREMWWGREWWLLKVMVTEGEWAPPCHRLDQVQMVEAVSAAEERLRLGGRTAGEVDHVAGC